jgi:hypothetical protein
MVIPSLSPSILYEGTIIPPLNQEIIPHYTGLIVPGTGEDISPAAGQIPMREDETEDKTPGGDPGGEYNPTTNTIPHTASYPLGYPSLMVPDLPPAPASWADAGSGPVISFSRLPIMFPL